MPEDSRSKKAERKENKQHCKERIGEEAARCIFTDILWGVYADAAHTAETLVIPSIREGVK